MSQTINRIYRSHDEAQAAVATLKLYGFHDQNIRVLTASSPPTTIDVNGNPVDGLVGAIMKNQVLRSHAVVLAEGLRKGATLITVHAPFGTAVRAIDVLDSCGPLPSGVPEETEPSPLAWDDAAPLSSMLHIGTAVKGAAPFSAMWNLPTLTRSRASLSGALRIPELAKSTSSVLAFLDFPLLSSKATPLSSLLNLPVLKR